MASKYNKALLGPIVAGSTTLAEVLRKLGLERTGGNYRYINGCIRKLQLDTSHFAGRYARRIANLTKAELAPLVARSKSVAEVAAAPPSAVPELPLADGHLRPTAIAGVGSMWCAIRREPASVVEWQTP